MTTPRALFPLFLATLPLAAQTRDYPWEGITVLTGKAKRVHRDDDGEPAARPVDLTMIPYYSWCHRGANEMAVWLPRTSAKAQLPPISTTANTAKAGASHNSEVRLQK